MLDQRAHPTQSLISPALATFQGEAICMYLPGITLDAEQVCRLQQPAGERPALASGGGDAMRVSPRISSMYTIAEVPCIVSGAAMYLFDPSGRYIGGSVVAPTSGKGDADGAKAAGSHTGAGLGRAYPLVPNDLPNRFPDQFAPLALFGFNPAAGRPMAGTLVRLPLRSHLLAAHSAVCRQFWSPARVHSSCRSSKSTRQCSCLA